MSLCPESTKRSAMTDAEFWDYVFGCRNVDSNHWRAYTPDIYAIDCVRCGRLVDVEPDGRERDAFCDDCADECAPGSEGELTDA